MLKSPGGRAWQQFVYFATPRCKSRFLVRVASVCGWS